MEEGTRCDRPYPCPAGVRGVASQRPEHLPGLLDAALQGVVVRTRRALRGGAGAEHPRVFIWGSLEARLQSAEVIALVGLVERARPPLPDPGPWPSRPTRDAIGLPPPERLVGQAAHDFAATACAVSTVVLLAPSGATARRPCGRDGWCG